MPQATKLRYILVMMVLYLGGYIWIQAAITTHKFDFLTTYDMAIPFMPQFVWIYHSILPAILITMMLLVHSRQLFYNTFWAAMIATIILNVSYVAFPSFYPREVFEVATLSEAIVEWTRQIDASNNTFPSGHVTFSWLLCLGMWNSITAVKHSYLRRLYLLWAIGVSLSTLVLKQHYIVDVVSGALLAAACFYLAKPITSLYMKLVTSDADAPLKRTVSE